MRRLYLRIYAVVLSVLLAFAALAGGVFQYHAQAQSEQEQAAWLDLTGGWVDPALAPFAEADAPLGQRLWWVAASLAALLALVAEEAAWFDAEVSGAPVTVQGDERLLRRAVRNLLDNARRYAPEQPPQVRVQRGAAGQAQVWVCDRGPGVPADARERIFEPFFRLPGHAEARGGVGLGLALVRQIAQLHGGHVHCEEHRGGGSCFVLSLPADDPPPQPISRANASR
jgi:signal transduction histidine kinase